jgi:tRNA(His) 5'-end guanylyltransferase
MANSRFEYVRNFELADNLLPSTYLVVRIDGKGFHRYALAPQRTLALTREGQVL